jgi:hypothetical protein
MNKLKWVTGLSLLTLLLGSCTSDREISQAPTPKPSVGQVAVNPQLPAPSVPQTTKPAPGLILPKRAIDLPIPQGRPDPFGSVAVAPVKQPVSRETARPQQTTQQAGRTKQNQATPDGTSSVKTNPKQTGNNNQHSSAQQKATRSHQHSSTQQKVTTPKQQPLLQRSNSDRPLNVPPAPTPSTELASAVEVKGVMSVGGKVSAIVKTPNEPSRSVSAGDYLSGGAVRVKRIELGVDREPVVVLEQNGVEVVKAVSNNNSPIASL